MTPEEARRLMDDCREKIDNLDRQLVELLNQRSRAVEEIGRAKGEAGMPVFQLRREYDVYHNVLASNHGPLTPDALKRIFSRVIDEMRNIQKVGHKPAAGER